MHLMRCRYESRPDLVGMVELDPFPLAKYSHLTSVRILHIVRAPT